MIPSHWTIHDGQGMPVDAKSSPAVMFRRKAYGMKANLTLQAGKFHAGKWENFGHGHEARDCWKWEEEGPDDIIAYLEVG